MYMSCISYVCFFNFLYVCAIVVILIKVGLKSLIMIKIGDILHNIDSINHGLMHFHGHFRGIPVNDCINNSIKTLTKSHLVLHLRISSGTR